MNSKNQNNESVQNVTLKTVQDELSKEDLEIITGGGAKGLNGPIDHDNFSVCVYSACPI